MNLCSCVFCRPHAKVFVCSCNLSCMYTYTCAPHVYALNALAFTHFLRASAGICSCTQKLLVSAVQYTRDYTSNKHIYNLYTSTRHTGCRRALNSCTFAQHTHAWFVFHLECAFKWSVQFIWRDIHENGTSRFIRVFR
jgi:hypothetical protein